MGGSAALTSEETAVAAGVIGASMAMVTMLLLAFWILCIIARWKIFTKAGEKGWKSIIPVYADYVQWRIGWKKTGLFWIAIIMVIAGLALGFADGTFVSSANGFVYSGTTGTMGLIGSALVLVAAIINLVAVYKLFASFGHGIGWFIGYIIVSNIMLLVLGFGSSQYYGPRD